ncbi:MAG: accessory factor UbiK family protein [Pseudomonadota bacterium]
MPRSPQDLFSELRGQLDQFMPDMARVARDDVEQHVRMAVTSVIDRLDLVTREEFDAQSAVLTRTREKVEALETRVAELEEQLGRDQQ